jgi:predicted nucleic acid-binding Zn finger protein
MASGETIPVLKEGLVELTLGRSALKIWVFVAKITDYFILGLDVLRVSDASVDLGQHVLRLAAKKCRCGVPEHEHDHSGSL